MGEVSTQDHCRLIDGEATRDGCIGGVLVYNANTPPRGTPMSITPALKTATFTLRMDPCVKRQAERAAQSERRSLASLIEVLLLEHCQRQRQARAAAAGEVRP